MAIIHGFNIKMADFVLYREVFGSSVSTKLTVLAGKLVVELTALRIRFMYSVFEI
jgi:hypothetical protein